MNDQVVTFPLVFLTHYFKRGHSAWSTRCNCVKDSIFAKAWKELNCEFKPFGFHDPRMALPNQNGKDLNIFISNLLPPCSLGLAALVPRRLGVRLNVGNLGEFLENQDGILVVVFKRGQPDVLNGGGHCRSERFPLGGLDPPWFPNHLLGPLSPSRNHI